MRILTLFFGLFFAVTVFSQNSNINQKAELSWQTKNGLPYIKDFSGAYSVEVFNKIDENNFCFLSKSEKKIIFFDTKSNTKTKEINLDFSPVDMLVENDKIFVAGLYNFYTIDFTGKILSKKFIFDKIHYVSQIKFYNNKTYIIDNQQNSWLIDKENNLIKNSGIILGENIFGKINKNSETQYTITIYEKGKESYSKIINTNKTGTVRLLGLSNNNIFVEEQNIIQEIPLKVSRIIKIYQLQNQEISFINKIKLPDLYYTYVKRDIEITDKNISFFISSPNKAYIFELPNNQITAKAQIKFPEFLYQTKYHYNDYLEPVNEIIDTQEDNTKSTQTAITRQEIIDNAEPYAIYEWYCNPENIKDYDCGGEHVTTPLWVQVGNNISIPYMWGGFSSLSQFDQGISDGVSAGDTYTVGNGAGSSCAVGVDCSGFVSRCWNLPYKYGTSTLPNISTAYSSFSELKRGDIVNYAGSHVRLVHSINSDGSFLIIEAAGTGTNWRVGYNNYTTADLQDNYVPRYYDDVVEDPLDTDPPVTEVADNDWQSTDFQVSFTDSDNNQVDQKFYHVCYFDGNQWLGNTENGFLHDNFTGTSINPQWIQYGSTWTNINETLNQADETNANTNIYANVSQTDGYTYLYKWRMKISGSGTNRRAGIYFMCDDPTATQRNNAYMVYFRVDQNTCQIYKSENDVIDLKTDDPCTVNLDEWFNAMVVFNTNTGKIKVYKNGVLVSSWIDVNPHTTGNSISLRTGEANVSYDDFAIYKSRDDVVTITVGANGDAKYENPDPNTPACFVESMVSDVAENFSDIAYDYVNIDTTPPVMTIINDGLSTDIDTSSIDYEISGNWQTADEPNSNILNYYYSVGTSPFADDIISWTDNGTNLNFTDNVSLSTGETYYISVKAVNSANLESDVICSDGFIIDTALSIKNKKESIVKIYPVPTNTKLYIKSNNFINNIQIVDTKGNIQNVEITGLKTNMLEINVKNLAKGTYFIKTNQKTYKFIKE